MSWIQRIALTLIVFGVAGLGLIGRQPSGMATTPGEPDAFDLAISSGAELKLSENSLQIAAEAGQLSCDKVINLGGVSIGARCITAGRRLSHRN